MNRSIALGALVTMLGAGCATNSGVKEQISPLNDRLTQNEQTQASIQKKLDAMSSDMQGLKQQVQAASVNADAARKAGEDAQAAASRADAAATRAEQAAADAQKGAKKSTKAFELKQKK